MFPAIMLISMIAHAHPPGLSSMEAQINPDRIAVRMTFALQDIEAFSPMDLDLDAEISDEERESSKPNIATMLAEKLQVVVDGKIYAPLEPGKVSYDQQNNAHVEYVYQVVPHHELLLRSRILEVLPDGAQQFATIHGGEGSSSLEKLLDKANDQISMRFDVRENPRVKQSAMERFGEFFKLGVEHILTGYDHLLFLFALLAVTHSFWPAIKIITFFTVAHSITLACAGLNIIELPSRFVEPFIAMTIIYVGLENIIRGEHPKGRHWLTFAFGLGHGFGFASVLREMEITSGDTGILAPLLSFNLGIETGQIAVAIIVLPIIWRLNNQSAIADKFLKGCSLLVSLMGAYWLYDRLMS